MPDSQKMEQYHTIEFKMESYHGNGIIPWKWDHTMEMGSYHTMESYQGHGIIPKQNHTIPYKDFLTMRALLVWNFHVPGFSQVVGEWVITLTRLPMLNALAPRGAVGSDYCCKDRPCLSVQACCIA